MGVAAGALRAVAADSGQADHTANVVHAHEHRVQCAAASTGTDSSAAADDTDYIH